MGITDNVFLDQDGLIRIIHDETFTLTLNPEGCWLYILNCRDLQKMFKVISWAVYDDSDFMTILDRFMEALLNVDIPDRERQSKAKVIVKAKERRFR